MVMEMAFTVFKVTEEGILMNAVFFMSFACHYVWLYHYTWNGVFVEASYYRWPNRWEAVGLAFNASFTVASFLEVVRRLFGFRLRFRFLTLWPAAAFLFYAVVLLIFHTAWIDTSSFRYEALLRKSKKKTKKKKNKKKKKANYSRHSWLAYFNSFRNFLKIIAYYLISTNSYYRIEIDFVFLV